MNETTEYTSPTEATQRAQNLKERAQGVATNVGVKARETTENMGKQAESFAQTIRERAPHEGSLGAVASSVADRMEGAGAYLQEKSFDNMVEDLTTVIRRYPMQSLLVGLGIGYLLARGTDSRH